MQKLISFFLLLSFFVSAYAKDQIHFGVFAYTGYEKTREKYQPLIDYLNEQLGNRVVLEVLTQEEMNNKIAKGQLDIVTTNPTHFLVIRQQYALSGAIATLISVSEEGTPACKLGGAIIVRRDSPIRTLQDIEGKTIATPSTEHMGGFRAQAYEMYNAGIDLSDKKTKIIETFGSHQEVVHDVLTQKTDVGFIRDGILEEMLRKGEIKAGDIRIIHEQHPAAHPYKVSTRLYPEWPVFALPHADHNDVKALLAALFSLKPTNEAIKKQGIYGYTLPADYLEVEELSRHLRLPPFEAIPEVTYTDIWEHYKVTFVVIIFFMIIGIVYYNQQRKKKNLFESLLSNIGDGVFGVDENRHCTWINQRALEMIGFTEKEVLYKDQHALFHHHKPSNEIYPHEECPVHMTLIDGKTRHEDDYFIRRDGTFFPVSLTVSSLDGEGVIVVFRDITERKLAEEALQKSEMSLLKAQNMAHLGNWELDLRTNTLEWSDEIFRIFEMDKSRFAASYEAFLETIHPDDRESVNQAYLDSLQTKQLYTIDHRLVMKDGRVKWVREVGDSEYDAEGNPLISRGTVQDITEEVRILQELKEAKSKLEEVNTALQQKSAILEELAMFDGLTHIPNRRFFDEMYERKYKETSRDKKTLAVIMIDVDYFKPYNDHYGHLQGDACLITIAEALKKSLKRPTDMVARYGGEEFVVILKNIDREGANNVVERLIETVRALQIPHAYSDVTQYVTISAGMAFKEADSVVSKEELLKRADEALYLAKSSGRDKVACVIV